MSGWGLKFFDYDNDGEIDLLLANGHPDLMVETWRDDVKYLQPMLLFRNTGSVFENVSPESGPIFSKPIAGRGLALGDFDNDGAVDVLVGINDAAPILLRNNAGRQNHWLGIRLIGRKANIDAIGAKVTYRSGDFERHRFKVGGGSYLSSHDPRMVLGLGQRTKIDWIEVKWPLPSGRVERITGLPIDRYVTIVEGDGKWK
jgi:enediyne biosynthesis protein E4